MFPFNISVFLFFISSFQLESTFYKIWEMDVIFFSDSYQAFPMPFINKPVSIHLFFFLRQRILENLMKIALPRKLCTHTGGFTHGTQSKNHR